jgi:uncharacterized membrane protein YhaH (DUF805 family)
LIFINPGKQSLKCSKVKISRKRGVRRVMDEMREFSVCEGSKMGRIGHRPYWVLNLSILIRAVHQVGAAVFLASFLLGERVPLPLFYLVLVFGSGLALFFCEWMRHRQICRELSGVSTMVKLLLLGAAYHGFLSPPVTVLVAFVLASIGSHAPKLVRHRLLF